MSGSHARSPSRADLPEIRLPERYNYVAAFLTLGCNLQCPYCINWFNAERHGEKPMPADDWLRGLNRLRLRPDLPVTLQGGEPSLHPGFYDILNGLRADLNIDILTNLQFDVEEFMARVAARRLRRDAPYASIRVSYHPAVMDLARTKAKVLRLLAKGYSVGIWAVRHPAHIDEIERARAECIREGIDFRFKEFLGYHEGRLHGRYKYPDAVGADESAAPPGNDGKPPAPLGDNDMTPPGSAWGLPAPTRQVQCRTSELIIGPSGGVYRCHSDLYHGRPPIGHILDEAFTVTDVYRTCDAYGTCNPCDVKVKTNRFQEFGHTSVDIQFPPAKGARR